MDPSQAQRPLLWLSGRYRGYKANTDVFTKWLTFSATEAGYQFKNPKNDTGNVGTAISHAQPTIKVSRLPDLAKFVAARPGPRLLVPGKIIAAAKSAIQARVECSAWYEASRSGADGDESKTQDSSHAFFTKTLRSTLAVLEPYSAPPAELPESQEVDPEALANKFELLVAEDGGDAKDEANPTEQPTTLPKALPKTEVTLEVEESESKLDIALRVYYTMLDFDEIRKALRDAREAHSGNQLDLIVAAVMTGVAFHSMEEVERGALQVKFGGKDLNGVDIAKGFVRWCGSYQDDPLLKFDGLEHNLCLPIAKLVESCLVGPLTRESIRTKFGEYDPTTDQSTLTETQKVRENAIIIARLISEVRFYPFAEQGGYQLSCLDKFARTIRDMARQNQTQVTSLWLCFAVQIFVDIENALRPKPRRLYMGMRIHGNVTKAVVQNYGKFLKSPEICDLHIKR